jgi:hypothetical protein
MHRVAIAVGLLVSSACGQAPAPTQDDLLAAKLKSSFLQQAPWFTDWDEALAAAKQQRRLVFAYFTTVND